ncbi:MAG: hypothetical protein U5K29_03215 [Acidimicrobiales bacterium]|nr:hypothetical protein [Acidimicrobiales bacterium]
MGRGKKDKKKASTPVAAPEVFGNQHLSGKAQSIGQDSANEVFKVNYKDQYAMDGETSGYFKPDATMAPAKNAVGASRLAQGMGWGDLIPETHYATHDVKNMHGKKMKGVEGAVSKAAEGSPLMSPVFDTLKESHKGGSTDGVKVKGGKAYELSGFETNGDVDLSKPNTQKQLNQLQWFDALIGNEDRHGANILVDPKTGEVSGIDNDLSFGNGMQATSRYSKLPGKENEDFSKGRDGKFLGLPDQIDEDTAGKLLGLRPEAIASMLDPEDAEGSGMSEKELQQTYQRLALIQLEIAKHQDEGKVVSEWDDTTYQAALDAEINYGNFKREIPRSYVQRHDKALKRAADPTDTDWWRKGNRAADSPGSLGLPVPQPTPAPPATAPVPTPTPTPASTWVEPSASPPQRKRSGLTLGSRPSPRPVPPPQSAKPNRTIPRPAPPTTPPPVPPQSAKPNRTIPRPLPPTPGGGGTATKTAPKAKPVLDRLKGTPFDDM